MSTSGPTNKDHRLNIAGSAKVNSLVKTPALQAMTPSAIEAAKSKTDALRKQRDDMIGKLNRGQSQAQITAGQIVKDSLAQAQDALVAVKDSENLLNEERTKREEAEKKVRDTEASLRAERKRAEAAEKKSNAEEQKVKTLEQSLQDAGKSKQMAEDKHKAERTRHEEQVKGMQEALDKERERLRVEEGKRTRHRKAANVVMERLGPMMEEFSLKAAEDAEEIKRLGGGGT